MDAAASREFVSMWILGWNRRDVDGVVAHLDPQVRFTSPRAKAITGANQVVGREAMRKYWHAASAGIATLEFTLKDSFFDAEKNALSICYIAKIDDQVMDALELYLFGDDGFVKEGEAFYGARV